MIGETPLDRTRPLWTGTLVENLEGGRSAYLLQLHHCLMDGAAAMQLFAGIHSSRAEPSPDKPVAEPGESEHVTPLELTAGDLAAQVRGAPATTLRALDALGRAIANPARSLRYLGSLRRVLSPPSGATPSPLQSRQTGRTWRFGVLDCGLAELKAAGRAAGGSVNDAYIAALFGGLQRYHDAMGVELGDIPVAMPVSLRRPEDPPGGNRFAAAMFAGPAGIRDPVQRLASIRDTVRGVREEPALDYFGALSPVLSRMPSQLLGPLVQSAATRARCCPRATSLVCLTRSMLPARESSACMSSPRFPRCRCWQPCAPTRGRAASESIATEPYSKTPSCSGDACGRVLTKCSRSLNDRAPDHGGQQG